MALKRTDEQILAAYVDGTTLKTIADRANGEYWRTEPAAGT